LGTISLIPSRMAHNSQSQQIYQNILHTHFAYAMLQMMPNQPVLGNFYGRLVILLKLTFILNRTQDRTNSLWGGKNLADLLYI